MNVSPRVFISYSWDDIENQEWVLALVADLRQLGVLAELDINQTQKGLVHLDTMMVNNIQENDFVIVLLTPDYVKKANAQLGGVGVETRLIMNILKSNPDKIIPILLKSVEAGSPVPFFLENYLYIDFRTPANYKVKLNDLLYRIYNKNLIDLPAVGEPPQLVSRKIQGHLQSDSNDRKFIDSMGLVPNLKQITDRDKNIFMKESFQTIIFGLDTLLNKTRESNQNFEFDKDAVTSLKNVYSLYVDGNLRFTLKIWLGNAFGGSAPSINLSYDKTYSDSDNSYNEIIQCELNSEKSLGLKMTMNIMGKRGIMRVEEVVKEIWAKMVARIE